MTLQIRERYVSHLLLQKQHTNKTLDDIARESLSRMDGSKEAEEFVSRCLKAAKIIDGSSKK